MSSVIQNSLTDFVHFPNNRTVPMWIISSVSGSIKDLLKPVSFLDFWSNQIS